MIKLKLHSHLLSHNHREHMLEQDKLKLPLMELVKELVMLHWRR